VKKSGLLALLVMGCASMPENMAPPPLPTAVTVPAGHKHALTLKAIGTLNYECRARAGMSGAYGWVLDAPEASLLHWSGLRVGRYYGGPTWEYRDGSKLSGRVVATSPSEGLPIQLVQATPAGRKGELSDVTYIQRLNAQSAPAPDVECTGAAVGRGHKAEFSADFLFYRRR
jgi:uncharacterized protein DUF3455